MAIDTTTIRVSRDTRDLLAEQARLRGESLSSMLARFAKQVEREAAFRSEREATRTEIGNADAVAEEREWEATLSDGID